MPRTRKIKLADPLDFDHRADALAYADVHDLPGGDVLLTTADLAKRWRDFNRRSAKIALTRKRPTFPRHEQTPGQIPIARRRRFRKQSRRIQHPAGALDWALVRRIRC
jgi:hypothetical protein